MLTLYICTYKALQNTLTEPWHVDNQKYDTCSDLIKRTIVKIAALNQSNGGDFLFNPLELGIQIWGGKCSESLKWTGSRATRA